MHETAASPLHSKQTGANSGMHRPAVTHANFCQAGSQKAASKRHDNSRSAPSQYLETLPWPHYPCMCEDRTMSTQNMTCLQGVCDQRVCSCVANCSVSELETFQFHEMQQENRDAGAVATPTAAASAIICTQHNPTTLKWPCVREAAGPRGISGTWRPSVEADERAGGM